MNGNALHYEPTVLDIIGRRADLTPNRIAILEWDQRKTYTYNQLNQRASKLSKLLKDLGAKEGDRISIMGKNNILHVDLFFSCSKLGTIFTPINFRLGREELSYILEDSKPSIILCEDDFIKLVEPLSRKSKVIPFDEAESIMDDTKTGDEDLVPPRTTLKSPHTIFYTSGTTGKPKGAIISHSMILWNSFNTIISWELTKNDVAPVLTPLFHSGGFNVLLIPLLHVGGRVILTRSFSPEEALNIIEKERITILFMVPTMFRMLMECDRFWKTDLSSIRFCISGGAPCPKDIIETFHKRGITFRQGFGMTEAGVNCFSMTDEDAHRKVGSIGKPIFHMRARIVDENGNDTDEGELILKGPNIMSGYWGMEEETRKTIRDGWLHTGDLARRDKDGFFYIVGRKKEMFITGGENVFFAEIEAALLSHPKVKDAAVIAVPDQKWGEVGKAVVVLKEGERASEEELKNFLSKSLARYKIPKYFVFTDAIPRNPYGKVLRGKLIEMFGKNP